uniref:Possible LytR-membrane bound transcriptional regulator n=1 Tax=Paulinella chromatophora TaxID=39717 RepID=B1X5H9_PAUCH|nr:possible LytR-membrane bound transcriptional regulator [Paulinella chromatophora]ACB43198.1 possible LytR-membrane bound transcriptional regulator [Paulinella chromatophora]
MSQYFNVYILKAPLFSSLIGFSLGIISLSLTWTENKGFRNYCERTTSRKIPTSFPQPITLIAIKDVIDNKSNYMVTNKLVNNRDEELFLFKFYSKKSLQIIQISKGLRVSLPGQKKAESLENIYRLGNIALFVDVAVEIGILDILPDRYIVLPDKFLKLLLKNKHKTPLNTGHFCHFDNDKIHKFEKKLSNKNEYRKPVYLSALEKIVLSILVEQLYRPSVALKIPDLIQNSVEGTSTNLDETEIVALILSILRDSTCLHFKRIPRNSRKSINMIHKLQLKLGSTLT